MLRNVIFGTMFLLMFVPLASADPTLCSGLDANGLALTDMTYRGGNATDCYGVVPGNDKNQQDQIQALWGDSWAFLTASDEATAGNFQGVSFTLTATPGTSGDWTLTATDAGGPMTLPAFVDFVGVIKAGSNFAAYFFDNVAVEAGPNNGTYNVRFGFNPRGIPPGLSHLSLYIRETEGPGPGPVPEPTSLVLLGSGILLFAAVRRFRK